MYKALQIYECDPKELIALYKKLQAAGVYVPQPLIDDEVKEAAVRFADPHDVMFNPRLA